MEDGCGEGVTRLWSMSRATEVRKRARVAGCTSVSFVDVGVQPLGDCRDVATDLVELDDPQGLIGTVVLPQRLEPLCGGELLGGREPLTPTLPV